MKNGVEVFGTSPYLLRFSSSACSLLVRYGIGMNEDRVL